MVSACRQRKKGALQVRPLGEYFIPDLIVDIRLESYDPIALQVVEFS